MALNKGIWVPKPRVTNIEATNLKTLSLGCRLRVEGREIMQKFEELPIWLSHILGTITV